MIIRGISCPCSLSSYVLPYRNKAFYCLSSSVHHCAITLPDPVRTPTPYGGRLTWTLPGGTTLVVHLKDKNKIRHRKRWSQCMYMYYLLAYRLVGLRDDSIWENDQKGHFRKGTAFVPGSIFRYMPEEIAREVRASKESSQRPYPLDAICSRDIVEESSR